MKNEIKEKCIDCKYSRQCFTAKQINSECCLKDRENENKEERKLKDMIDFLENIYKDIKKQPTLEEELEKERKFINKIKGDNKDEMKELLENIEILDNTDYILHSDKAKRLLDYITNLQEENERLAKDCDMWNRKYNEEFDKNSRAIENNYGLQEKYCHSALFDDLVASKIYEITEKQLNILQGEDTKESEVK